MPAAKKPAKKRAKKRAKKAPGLEYLIAEFTEAANSVVDLCPPGEVNVAIKQMREAFLMARRRGSLRQKQYRMSAG